MADEIKQLAFKQFTTSELVAGSAANVLTTDASTHYVIKGIEATQGDNDSAVVATATLGLTAGLAAGQYASLGTVAKKDRVGLSGSAIMDASSTLTIRPTATTITFLDEKVFSGKNSSAGTVNEIFVKSSLSSVNGLAEPTLSTETTVDKSTGTYSGSYDSLTGNVPDGNFKIHHTNANGVNLILVFGNGTSSGPRFAVWNADTNVQYGYYSQSYDTAIFDGERYIFWVVCDAANAATVRVRWYDLDESTSNLEAANTTGGGNNANFWHGQTAVFTGNAAFTGRTSYDNHLNAFYRNRHTNNKRYFCGYSNSNNRGWLVEFPDTLTNDASTTPAPKWVYLSSSSASSSGGSDPFNNNGSSWNMTQLISSNQTPDAEAQMRLTYDPVVSRYMLWYSRDNNKFWPMTFTQDEIDGTSNAGLIDQGTGSTGHGLRVVAEQSAVKINVDSNVAENGSNNNMTIEVGADNSYAATTTGAYAGNTNSTMSPAYVDGSNWYFRNVNSSSDSAYKVVKVDYSNVTTAVNLIPNTAIPTNVFASNMFVSFATPNLATISSRTYTKAPSLKVRVSGILSDQ